MSKQSQSSSSSSWFGPQSVGQRKRARPFRANAPVEVQLSSSRARGKWSFAETKHRRLIRTIVASAAQKSTVKVDAVSIQARGLVLIDLRAGKRDDLARFLRAIAGLIPRGITGSEKGRSTLGGRPFWDGLVATRLKA